MSQNFPLIFAEAHAAGKAAADAMAPVPMVVGEPKQLFGDEIDFEKPVYYVPDGVCGFAWIKFPSARGPAVSYMKKYGIGRKSYEKGWQIWVHSYGQSMERKYAYASAYSKVLRGYGIDAYAGSRMD